jgi:hypothetical protein
MAGDQRSGGRGEPCSDRFIDQSPADTHDGGMVTALRLLVRDGVREGCAGVSPKASGGSTIQDETSG